MTGGSFAEMWRDRPGELNLESWFSADWCDAAIGTQVDLDVLAAANDPLLAVDAMRWGLIESTNQRSDVDGAVALPLKPAEVARHHCPEWPALLHSLELYRGPLAVPGIYLLARGHSVSNSNDVEYTAPVPIPSEVGSDTSCFYQTWRTPRRPRAAGSTIGPSP